MEQKFYELFDHYEKKHSIITTEKYQEIIEKIEELSKQQKGVKKSQQQWNLLRQFTIRIDSEEKVLYHGEQKVVKRKQLFELLEDAHKKTVHGGQNVMWKELRAYYGISK